MRIRVSSDVHLEFNESGHGIPDLGSADALILGGDILCARHFKTDGPLKKVYKDFLQKCSDNFEHVIYIKGNHEPWGHTYQGTHDLIKENLPSNIYLLENDYVKIKNIIFLGATLWTDFFNENPLEMMEAQRYMRDYTSIRIGSNYRKLRPEDTLGFHKQSKQFLIEKLEEFKNEKIWVCTHHAPSYQSIHPKYRAETMNGAFASNLDDLILNNPQIKYWSHGHTHDSFDYMIGGCRVICNPRGYYTGVNSNDLNPDFDPNFEIEVDD
jgi:predicted phosphodiesterase